ncbi:hypothetical protein BDC45DRAFT_573125 [Circinella umbellata]|nr:hypothetical protein BDC45DRAFT_573125 [Circinella umbellata]
MFKSIILLMTTTILMLCSITYTQAAAVPSLRSMHELCTQNLVCSDGLYCRRYNGALYGTCEDPNHV